MTTVLEPGPTAITGLVVSQVRDRLPENWSLQEAVEPRLGGITPDLVVDLEAPDGRSARVIVEIKTVVQGRDVAGLQEQFRTYTSVLPGSHPMAAARYLSPPTRERLTERGISYVDTTGNMDIRIDDPALFISDRGADTDPGRGRGRPRGTLAGAPAAAVVRAITDFDRDWSISTLIKTAEVSTGAGYRVVDFLESEGLVERPSRGKVTAPSWSDVLRRWSQDYSFVGDSTVSTWIAARGLPDLLRRAAATDPSTYAVTGTLAAAQWAEYAPARSAMIYVRSTDVAKEWDLRPAEAGANVMLGLPSYETPFVRARADANGVMMAAPAQVAVDLLTGPGRNPSEAEELLSWMSANEGEWRGRR